MTAIVENQEVKIGDAVGFKSDIEQYGIIQEIRRSSFGGIELKLTPASGRFQGEYLDSRAPFTIVRASDCWID